MRWMLIDLPQLLKNKILLYLMIKFPSINIRIFKILLSYSKDCFKISSHKNYFKIQSIEIIQARIIKALIVKKLPN